MSIILQRLNTSFGLSLQDDDSANTSALESKIRALDECYIEKLVLHHTEINMEYALLGSKITKEFLIETPKPLEMTGGETMPNADLHNLCDNNEKLKKQLKSLLYTAILLEIIYQDYLYDPREVARLQKQQNILHHWLDTDKKITKIIAKNEWYTDEIIFGFTTYSNLKRLLIVRLRRLLLAIVPLTNELSFYSRSMKKIEQYAAPFFTHLSWIFFIPRLTVNLAMVLKHTIPHYWMSEKERQIGLIVRLRIQWNMRWPDISNDLPWLIANLTSAFVLTGSLAPYAVVLSICMQFYEIIQAMAQWHFETKHLREQLEIYRRLLNNNDKYILEIEQRLAFDDKRLWIPVWNTSVLLIAIILSSPALAAISSLLPIAGGCIAVTTTIVSLHKREQLKRDENPTKNLFSFFKAEIPPPCSNACISFT